MHSRFLKSSVICTILEVRSLSSCRSECGWSASCCGNPIDGLVCGGSRVGNSVLSIGRSDASAMMCGRSCSGVR